MFYQGFFFLFILVVLPENEQASRVSTRIYGGEFVKNGDLPYMVVVKQLIRGDICGGAIITSRHILTGGMCAKYHTKPFSSAIVVTGSVSLSRGGEIHRIVHSIAHPLFYRHYPDSIRFDIGVVTLCDEIKFNSLQKPIKLPNRPVHDGEDAIVSGWGHTENDTNPDILRKSNTKVYSVKTCGHLAESKSFSDGSRICTQSEKGTGFCDYDNGGPLVVDGVIVGIASLLYGCGLGKIEQYTNVYKCLRFILEEMESGCAPQKSTALSTLDSLNKNPEVHCKTCSEKCWTRQATHDYNFYV